MNLETKITIYKFTPQVFTLTQETFRIMLKTGDIQNAQIFFAFRLFQRRQSS